MSIVLRPYQLRGVEAVQEKMLEYKRIAFYLPQGSGKSIVLSYIAMGAMKKGNKVLILTHRQEILKQNMSKMENFGIGVQSIDPRTKFIESGADCYCAMSQTLASRIKKSDEWREWIKSIPLIIIDECHIGNHDIVLDHASEKAYFVGLSASMLRSGSGQTQLSKYYDYIVRGDGAKELIELGYLTPSKNFAFQAPKLSDTRVSDVTGDYVKSQLQSVFRKPERYAGIIENYKKLTPNTKTIVFTTGSQHCIDITIAFNEAGIKAKYLISDNNIAMNKELSGKREDILNEFRNNEFQVLVNITMLDTGFDEPSLETVILDFSTVSYARYSQAVGRGSRLFEGKKWFNVLDFGDNIARHGIYEQENPPMSLWHNVSKGGVAATKECPKEKGGCGRYMYVSAKECSYCGYVYPTQNDIYKVELTEIVNDFSGKQADRWVASQLLDGKDPRWILVQMCIKNPDRQHEAFLEAIEIIRKKDGTVFSPKYWYPFKKNILNKYKRSKKKSLDNKF